MTPTAGTGPVIAFAGRASLPPTDASALSQQYQTIKV